MAVKPGKFVISVAVAWLIPVFVKLAPLIVTPKPLLQVDNVAVAAEVAVTPDKLFKVLTVSKVFSEAVELNVTVVLEGLVNSNFERCNH